MELEQNARYRAKIELSFLQSLADNNIIAGKLKEAGFADVLVTGTGRLRNAVGRWPKEKMNVQLPAEVKQVQKI